ncbi:hypothetical protein GC096_35280 [Paenibacillus sp. LMG 31461]|uniref:Uncharacterized protein n=1 Tax=Paenibacillus plantarum TaxID=2654975 RepID=A0ABX1XL77_9BACL|nr:hypothetical protein [Paenibacillus plantarum]NOU69283.1 hypothetical protein [Paenibacillus plantarum]
MKISIFNIKKILESLKRKRIHIFIILGALILFCFLHIFTFGKTEIAPDLNNIYYYYSTSAQVIGAFVAFILAGYVFIHQFLDARQDKDDSLVDIHKRLKLNYYIGLRDLSISTFISIVLDLSVLVANDFDDTYPIHFKLLNLFSSSYKFELMAFTAVANIVTIFAAILLVIYIINPKTYEKALESLIEETQEKYHEKKVSRSDFFDAFVDLESDMREYVLSNKNVVIKSRYNNRENFSFKEMVDGLFYSGFINGGLYEELLEINKIRNLIFHGKLKEVDIGMVNFVKEFHVQFNNIKEKVKPEY